MLDIAWFGNSDNSVRDFSKERPINFVEHIKGPFFLHQGHLPIVPKNYAGYTKG
jgi:hypothetical protein